MSCSEVSTHYARAAPPARQLALQCSETAGRVLGPHFHFDASAIALGTARGQRCPGLEHQATGTASGLKGAVNQMVRRDASAEPAILSMPD
jgi:hypothetical protein